MTIRELVERYCVQKLASILYECLEFSDADRAETDWLTAENFVKRHPESVERIVDTFIDYAEEHQSFELSIMSDDTSVEAALSDFSYDMFVEICGREVWDCLYQPFRIQSGLPYNRYPHYTLIRFA